MAAGDYYGSGLVGGSGITITSNANWGSTVIGVDLKGNAEFNDLKNRLTDIEKQLCILKPNEALQAKYPALQEVIAATGKEVKCVRVGSPTISRQIALPTAQHSAAPGVAWGNRSIGD